MNPKISVVTVCFNAVDSIEKTILSVINQTYQNIEYIIIDGGSTDGTVDVIKKYADHISYWLSEPDKGIYDAMNKGIAKATGEWINFMNAGDTFVGGNIICDIFSLPIDDNVGFIYGGARLVDNIHIKNYRNKPFWTTKFSFRTGKGICHQSIFVKMQLAQDGFDQHYPISADFKMIYDIYCSGWKPLCFDALICNFDINGISSNKQNRLAALKEDATILKCTKSFSYIIYVFLIKIFRR